MVIHFECSADGWQHFESESWGPCRRMIEVLDDQMASRQIEVYRDGRVLVYDRAHPQDRYGMLIGLRFSRQDKWRVFFTDVRLIQKSGFDEAWRVFSAKAVQQGCQQ